MADFNPSKHSCKTKHPDWKWLAEYERWLISFEGGSVPAYRLKITIYKCSSCEHTHAILSESIIPYQSYSLLFIIAVMMDDFIRSLTVVNICAKYEISISTLYAWKKLFLQHKKTWLDLLEDAHTSSLQFMDGLTAGRRLNTLGEFFQIAGISFLQGSTYMKKAYSGPE